MKKIIVLKGTENVGKSSAILKFYELLLAMYPDAKTTYEIIDLKDIRLVLSINGVMVGIESQGDPNSRLKESLELFVEIKCQVIICSTRTWGKTVAAVEQVVNENNYIPVWLIKAREAEESKWDSRNLDAAKKILEEVEVAMRQ